MNYSDLSGLIKDIHKRSEKAKDRKLDQEILELNHQTMDLYLENIDLKHKIEKMENDNDFSKSIQIRDGVYYYKNEPDPYCMRCWDANKKKIHVVKTQYDIWICPEEIYQERKRH